MIGQPHNDPLMIDEPAKFHEGQEVEVELSKFGWHKAKIILNPWAFIGGIW